MTRYKIPVMWSMVADMEIEAESLESAMEQADKLPLPEGEYLDDSFEISEDCIPEINTLTPAELAYLYARAAE